MVMKNWLKQIRDGISREKEERDDKGEDISSLYEIIEDFLKALDYKQVKGIRNEFLERYEFHREVVNDVIRPRSKKKAATEPSSGNAVSGFDIEKVNEATETSDIRFRAIENRIEAQSRSLEDKIETRSEALEEGLKLRIGGVEKEISETSAHHLELIRLLQKEREVPQLQLHQKCLISNLLSLGLNLVELHPYR